MQAVDTVGEITADMGCEAAFRRIAEGCCAQIDSQMAVFLGSEDPAGPHKARVALRRLTSALDAFAPILRRKRAAELRAEAKAIFRALGRVRDADVFLARQGGVALARETRELRDDVRRDLRRQKAVRLCPMLLRDLAGDTLLKQKAPGLAARRAPVGTLARAALDLAWARGLAHGTDLATMAEEARHDFRKDMKTLRYLAEFFAPLWPGPGWPDFRNALQDLQDDLGLLNDLANARLRKNAPSGSKELAAEAAALKRAGKDWAVLSQARPFWQ